MGYAEHARSPFDFDLNPRVEDKPKQAEVALTEEEKTELEAE